jgi:hypothetical protein
MLHVLYWITNKVNGRFYIGYHKTDNPFDDYMGSGKILKRAVAKYGVENFEKEILAVCDTAAEALGEEEYLVARHLGDPLCMNLKKGGFGGFDYVNGHKLNTVGQQKASRMGTLWSQERLRSDPLYREELARRLVIGRALIDEDARNRAIAAANRSRRGYKHSPESCSLMSAHQLGESNSQFGTCWITDGFRNRKIDKNTLQQAVDYGWRRGRTGGMPVYTSEVRAKLSAATSARMKLEKELGIRRFENRKRKKI